MPDVQPKSLILDIYAFLRRLGGWVAIADLITLAGDLGVESQAVRSAVSRMKKSGLLAAENRNGSAGYALTEEAWHILQAGDERILNSVAHADLRDGWVIVVFSVPESERNRRYALRSRLVWLGFGQVEAGVWMAPRRALPDVRLVLERTNLARYVTLFEGFYAGPADVTDVIFRAWDIDQLRTLYRTYIKRHRPTLQRWRKNDDRPDREAFVEFMAAISEWRRLPYMDPGLPRELLPEEWEGHQARTVFSELRELLELRALRYVVGVVTRTGQLAGEADHGSPSDLGKR